MLNYILKYPGRIATPDASYPYGGAQNITVPGDGTGTPWDVALINDILGFFQKMVAEASITPSGSSETILASDVYDALDAFLSEIDDKYLPNNVEKLLLNDTSTTPGDVYIGQDYKGNIFIGSGVEGQQYYAFQASGRVFFAREATSEIYLGQLSTKGIEIGSTLGSHADKKLISLTKEKTFENIIDTYTQTEMTNLLSLRMLKSENLNDVQNKAAARTNLDVLSSSEITGAWVDITVINGHTADTCRYRLINGGNNVEFEIVNLDVSGKTDDVFGVAAASAPGDTSTHSTHDTSAALCIIRISNVGSLRSYTSAAGVFDFNLVLPVY